MAVVLGPEEAIRMAAAYTKAGIDFFSVIRGRSDTDVELAKVIPPMFTPASPHLEFAGWVKKQVDVPVMHASKIADVATARYAIAEGLLDLVGMTRALIADPDLPRKVAAGPRRSGAAVRRCQYLPGLDLHVGLDALHPQPGDRARAAVAAADHARGRIETMRRHRRRSGRAGSRTGARRAGSCRDAV